MINRICLFLVCFGVSTTTISAQLVLPELMIAKAHQGQIQVKWEPENFDEWDIAKEQGYDVVIEAYSNLGPQMVKSQKVKPLSSESYRSKLSVIDQKLYNFYRSSHDFLYPEESLEAGVNTMIKNLVKSSPRTIDSLQMAMLAYFSIFNSDIAESNGLGYSFKYGKEGKYKITVSVNGQYSKSIEVDTRLPKEKLTCDLEYEFSDRTVKLLWNSKEHLGKNYGYMIEKSTDGINFEDISMLPFVAPRKTKGEQYFGNMAYTDSLDRNYEDHYYRLKGFDYFGHQSQPYDMISGYGFDLIKYSPRIVMAEQHLDNTAFLQWEIEEIDYPLIDHFRIMRTDSTDGFYTIDVDSIPKDRRTYNVPMEHNTNHYRVETVPKDGEAMSSIPVFVMGIDSIPPPVPVAIGGTIDSLGRVEISWHASEASDLWGYRVFKSNFEDAEYTLVQADLLTDTVFVDSTHLDLGIKNVFYKIHAADKRNNKSEFSEVIVIEKPDIVPPIGAVITKIEQSSDTISLHWSPSPSDDVDVHKIFRRELKTERSWTLIAVLDTTASVSPYLDTRMPYNNQYGYTIVTTDLSGLDSDPCPMVPVFVEKPKEEFEAIKAFDVSFDKRSKQVVLNWDISDQEDIESYLLYRGKISEKMSRYKYIEGSKAEYSEEVTLDGAQMHYQLKPIYKTRKGSFYSDLVSVDLPTAEEAENYKPTKKEKKKKSKRGE